MCAAASRCRIHFEPPPNSREPASGGFAWLRSMKTYPVHRVAASSPSFSCAVVPPKEELFPPPLWPAPPRPPGRARQKLEGAGDGAQPRRSRRARAVALRESQRSHFGGGELAGPGRRLAQRCGLHVGGAAPKPSHVAVVAERCCRGEVCVDEGRRSVVHDEDARRGQASSRSPDKPITQTPG